MLYSMFYGIFKISKAINLKCLDMILKETRISIFIEKSKTDVYQRVFI